MRANMIITYTKYLLYFCLLFLTTYSFAQTAIKYETEICSIDYYPEYNTQVGPEIELARKKLDEFTSTFKSEISSKRDASQIVIPVVFHINDPVNPEKVSLGQIQSAIEILNEDFNGRNPEFSSVRSEFQEIAAYAGIRFALARLDPEGKPTNGITYHHNNYNGREPDERGSRVKSVSSWPNDQYLNIWIVNDVEGDGANNTSGWAFLPWTGYADRGIDGIVYNHRYLGREGTSVATFDGGQAHMARVLTHEVGHYLNLHHTFKNYCEEENDKVVDTPPVFYHGSNNCQQLGEKCEGVELVNDENYMDYTPCPSMFTEGQVARMIAGLHADEAYRKNLWSKENLEAVGLAHLLDPLTSIQPPQLLEPTISIYPNPTSSSVHMNFSLPSNAEIKVKLIDLSGRFATKLLHQKLAAGEHQLKFSVDELAIGMYNCLIQIEKTIFIEKIVILP